MNEPEPVTRDEIRAINGHFTRALRDQIPPGAELKVGEKMIERGLWKLAEGSVTPSTLNI